MLFLFLSLVPFVLVESSYIDLGRSFDEKTQYWIDVQPFIFTKIIAEDKRDGTWYAQNEFKAGEHGGTHLDAPYHFFKQGWKVGDIPLSKLIVPAVLMDMSEEVKNNADFELKSNHIKKWEEDHGDLPEGAVLLIRYGWGKHYNNRNKYFGFEQMSSTRLHFPGMAADGAEYLVKHRKLVGVGVDTPSVDTGRTTIYPAHIWIQGANIYILENLDLDFELPERDFTLIVMPMKITKGTGAPCRVVAMLNSSPYLTAMMTLLLLTAATRIF